MPRVKHFPLLKENGIATKMTTMVSFKVSTPVPRLIGQRAPDFVLPDHEGKSHRLHRYTAQGPVCLFVFPLSGSPFCVKEACAFRTAQIAVPTFSSAKTTIIGLCQDEPARLAKFVQQHNLPYPVLTDLDRKVLDQWGVGTSFFGLMNKRITFIIDSRGVVRGCAEGAFNYRGHIRYAEMWLARLESEDAFREQGGPAADLLEHHFGQTSIPPSTPTDSVPSTASAEAGDDWAAAYSMGTGGGTRIPRTVAAALEPCTPESSSYRGNMNRPTGTSRFPFMEMPPEPPSYQNFDELTSSSSSSQRSLAPSAATAQMDRHLSSSRSSHNLIPPHGHSPLRGPSLPSFHEPSSPSTVRDEPLPSMVPRAPRDAAFPWLRRRPPASAEWSARSHEPYQDPLAAPAATTTNSSSTETPFTTSTSKYPAPPNSATPTFGPQPDHAAGEDLGAAPSQSSQDSHGRRTRDSIGSQRTIISHNCSLDTNPKASANPHAKNSHVQTWGQTSPVPQTPSLSLDTEDTRASGSTDFRDGPTVEPIVPPLGIRFPRRTGLTTKPLPLRPGYVASSSGSTTGSSSTHTASVTTRSAPGRGAKGSKVGSSSLATSSTHESSSAYGPHGDEGVGAGCLMPPDANMPTFRPEDFRSSRVRSLRSLHPVSPALLNSGLYHTRLAHTQSTPHLGHGHAVRLHPPPV